MKKRKKKTCHSGCQKQRNEATAGLFSVIICQCSVNQVLTGLDQKPWVPSVQDRDKTELKCFRVQDETNLEYDNTTGSWCHCVSHSPRGLWVGLGLSSTMDCISGWSLTTMRGGRSLLRISELGWLRVEALLDLSPSSCPSSASLSVSDASPGTLQHPRRTVTDGEDLACEKGRIIVKTLTGKPWPLRWRAGEQAWRWCRPHRQSQSQTPRPAPLSGTCWTWLTAPVGRQVVR